MKVSSILENKCLLDANPERVSIDGIGYDWDTFVNFANELIMFHPNAQLSSKTKFHCSDGLNVFWFEIVENYDEYTLERKEVPKIKTDGIADFCEFKQKFILKHSF